MGTSRKIAGMLERIAGETGFPKELVREILLETPHIEATKEQRDIVFSAARKLGLDFEALRIGKRLTARREAVEEIYKYVENHPEWSRAEILDYIRYSAELMKRVQRRALPDFFP
ncbi:MAG: hypothetical protein N2234_01635 [Planctomycetota bacterium]|nr:hypothetical protein [Planctomycetota bacterium]